MYVTRKLPGDYAAFLYDRETLGCGCACFFSGVRRIEALVSLPHREREARTGCSL